MVYLLFIYPRLGRAVSKCHKNAEVTSEMCAHATVVRHAMPLGTPDTGKLMYQLRSYEGETVINSSTIFACKTGWCTK